MLWSGGNGVVSRERRQITVFDSPVMFLLADRKIYFMLILKRSSLGDTES